MSGDPLVSIRCMIYNHEPFLRQCLDGFVMQQTTFPFEAIVHDDASTDGSASMMMPRPMVPPPSSASTPRNTPTSSNPSTKPRTSTASTTAPYDESWTLPCTPTPNTSLPVRVMTTGPTPTNSRSRWISWKHIPITH